MSKLVNISVIERHEPITLRTTNVTTIPNRLDAIEPRLICVSVLSIFARLQKDSVQGISFCLVCDLFQFTQPEVVYVYVRPGTKTGLEASAI